MALITYAEGKTLTLPQGSTYAQAAALAQGDFAHDIVLVKSENKIKELHKKITGDETLEFITTGQRDGMLSYERTALMVLCGALNRVAGERLRKIFVDFSVINGYYVEVAGDLTVDQTFVEAVKADMLAQVKADLPIEKTKWEIPEAREYFRRHGMPNRDKLFRYRRHSGVNVYSIGDYVDYYYGCMLPSTGYLKAFDLVAYESGLALLLPKQENPEELAPFEPQPKVFNTLRRSVEWTIRMGIGTVGQINEKIAQGQATDMILMAEARQEMDIAKIAGRIAENPDIKCVMIAGPSSSGKTSFSHRLSVQLRGLGLKPHPVEVDNYFVDREFTPRDENGEYDFESIEGVDIAGFNRDMMDLLAGKRVKMPTFNFKTGLREYRGNTLKLGRGDILVVEGIHCLNDRMSADIPHLYQRPVHHQYRRAQPDPHLRRPAAAAYGAGCPDPGLQCPGDPGPLGFRPPGGEKEYHPLPGKRRCHL